MSPKSRKKDRRGRPSRKGMNREGKRHTATGSSSQAGAGGKGGRGRSGRRTRSRRARAKGWRLWAFRIASLVFIPALFIFLLEVGLRVGGYGFSATATVACDVEGVSCRGDNVKFGWRFFPRNIAQEFDPFVFPTVKPSNTYRIFVLGASAAQGTPDPAYSFGRILEVMLDQMHSERDFEVIVAAMPAINSHVVVDVAKDLAKYEPDLFVVYLGNNEVVGPYGPGTVFSPLSPSRALLRAGIAVRATRTGQLLANVASRLGAKSRGPKVWRGLEMFLNEQVPADDRRLETVYGHFRRNLEDIRRAAIDSGAQVIFCTVGSNVKDCPPFASLHRAGLSESAAEEWDRAYDVAVRREREGDHVGAIAGYLAAGEIDDRFADLQFRLARCYWLTGEHEKALDRFLSARDLDALRFRPDRRINGIIRDVVSGEAPEGVHLVDADELFRVHSPSGVPGGELFHEHVHLNFHGNYLLARAIFEKAEQIHGAERPASTSGEFPAPAESLCAERLAYNAWARYNVAFKVLNYYLKKPPFTNQLYHDEWTARLERDVKSLETALTAEAQTQIAAEYDDLARQMPSDIWLHLRLAEFLSVRMNDEHGAVEQCRQVQKLMPHSYKPHLLLALSLGRLNRLSETVEHLQKAVELKPTCGQAYHLLGLAYHARGQTKKALASYDRATKLRPDDTEAYRRMAGILLAQGKLVEAERLVRDALSVAFDDPGLHHELGVILRERGRNEEADRAFRTASRLDPNLPRAGPD